MTMPDSYKMMASPLFVRLVKRLPNNLRAALDETIRGTSEDPSVGDRKRGVLRAVFVEKFAAVNDQWLVAYSVDEDTRSVYLLAFGQHENSYRDLDRYIRR